MRWLKHAFSIDPPGPAEPTPEQQVPVDWMCRLAARKHMTTPAWMTLQVCRPLNWFGSMTMHFFSPAVWAVAPDKFFRHYKTFAGYLENRGSIDHMIRRVEHFEAHYQQLEQQARQTEDGDVASDPGVDSDGREDPEEEA